MEFKDYYKILEVDKKASDAEIKKSFRKLANKYHPDKNQGDSNAESKFKEINEAYEVLKDKEKRQKYDNLGSQYNRYRQTGGNPGGFNWSDWYNSGTSQNRSNYGNMNDMFSGGGLSDFFEKIFGGFSTGSGYTQKSKKGQSIEAKVEISLEDSYKGGTRVFDINGQKIEINLKPGIKEGQKLKISGKGYPGSRGGQNGDLFLKFSVKKNKKYVIDGNNLMLEHYIDAPTAALGGKTLVQTLSGNIEVNISSGTQSGKILKLKDMGMPIYGTQNKGDLLLKLMISVPVNLSEEEKSLYEKLKALRN